MSIGSKLITYENLISRTKILNRIIKTKREGETRGKSSVASRNMQQIGLLSYE